LSNNNQILSDDWYLPSSDELLLLYQAYQADPSSFYAISAPMNHGCRIWTSTEVDNDHAIALSPGGTFTTENKSYFLQVIPIRQF